MWCCVMQISDSKLLGRSIAGQLNRSDRWHVWGIEDVNAGFGAEIWGESDNLEDLDVDWNIMFIHVLKKDDEMTWNIFICNRIGTNCGYL